MNKQQIFFSQSQVTLIMVYKTILIFFSIINLAFGNIIYDKNNTVITQIELDEYVKIYKLNYNFDINYNKALKNIILMKKTISFLKKNNPNLINELDQKINSQVNENNITSMQRDFFRFIGIRNEFLAEYFQNEFSQNDIIEIFNTFIDLRLPISRNKCLTIEKIVNLKEDRYFIGNFFKNLRNNTRDFKTLINDDIYDVCIDNKSFSDIENSIVKFIEKKTESNFNNFVYQNKN